KSSTSYKEEKYRSTSNESPSTKTYPSSGANDDTQVYTSSRRFHSHDLSDRIRRRYKDLSRLIELDRQSFNILDMAPMPARAAYIRDIGLNNNKNQLSNNIDSGTSWTSNVKVQTNDDAEHVQSQTDEIDIRSMWTQHPSDSEHTACGSGNTNDENRFSDIDKTRENEELLRMLRLETDLGRYQTFVINAGKLIFALLDEQQTSNIKSKSKRSKDNNEQDGMQQESDLNFSSGVTILPGLSFKSEVSIVAVCFCQDKPEQVAVFYEPMYTTSYGAIYNVRDPEKPLRLLSCEASIRCCSSSLAYLFAGCHDGSVVLFDTSEPNKYKPDSQKPIPSSPTFSTANIQFNDRHYNEVIRVLPLRTTNMANKVDRSTNSFSLASLDRDGLIIIWSVVELMQSDEAGSIADLGLKPGGRVRMTQTSSIQIKQSIHMARDSIQAYDLSCPTSDVDNFYVASNANAVYHMTRYGEMGSPSKLRVSSDTGSQIEVTCLAFNPIINKLLLVGTGHGQLNLYTTGRDIVEHHQAPNSIDQRMDFEGLFSGDMGELSNMDTVSQVNPTEEDNTNQSQWQQQDDLNLDENTTIGGLSEETRTKIEECQNELDRLNSEKTNLNAQLAQMNNPALRNLLLTRINSIQSDIERAQMEYDQLSNM
ncbi:unnamed protein product, partial [Rotaria sordida]